MIDFSLMAFLKFPVRFRKFAELRRLFAVAPETLSLIDGLDDLAKWQSPKR